MFIHKVHVYFDVNIMFTDWLGSSHINVSMQTTVTAEMKGQVWKYINYGELHYQTVGM